MESQAFYDQSKKGHLSQKNDQNRFHISNKLERLEFILEKNIGIQKYVGKVGIFVFKIPLEDEISTKLFKLFKKSEIMESKRPGKS